MNRNEWYTKGTKRDLTFKRLVDKKLKQWRADNNITEACVIHHRDDNDVVKAYNEAHYERWGFDENNEFIEGKYVQFLTRSQHMSYHQSGDRNVMKDENTATKVSITKKALFAAHPEIKLCGSKNGMYGKNHTEETLQKLSDNNPWKGKHSNRLGACLTDEQKSHLSQINLGENNPMFGKHHSAESRQKISDNLKGKMSGEKNPFYGKKHDEESLKKMQDYYKYCSEFYKTYKGCGGELTWKQFTNALKNDAVVWSVIEK